MSNRADEGSTSRSAEHEIASGRSPTTPIAMIMSVIVVLGALFAVVLAIVTLSYTLA
ncbi:MAG: hypothetical protein ACRDPV_03810 [Gaiellaceae bacterium]